jgi:periplasmic divalent cation tolerance protein
VIDVVQVTTTVGSRDDARRLARLLVDEHLAACVQVVGPIESTYRWRGAVQTEAEWLLVAKTTADRYDAIEARLVEEHPYDVPEVLAVPVTDGNETYLDWVVAETVSD